MATIAWFYTVITIISSLVMVMSALTFLIYLIGWKFKNRKRILKLTFVCAVISFLIVFFALSSVRFVYEMKLKSEKIFKYLQEYYTDKGFYPSDINDFETKCDSYYETFNNDKDFALFFGVNQLTWVYCTASPENENCIPTKWLFRKDGKHQWLDIPDKYRKNVILYAKHGDFNIYNLEH